MSEAPSLASTYGAWLISLFLETILYGIGFLQACLYFQWYPTDAWSIKFPVALVLQEFGVIQVDLLWSDSLQLLANYLSAFIVQIYFTSRIYRLMREPIDSNMHKASDLGVYAVGIFAVVEISAGIAQTVLSYQLRSFAKLENTKAITTLQTAGSLACDIGIMVYLWLRRTEKMMNALMINAVNRGMLTALSSAFTMILFLVYPDTFWFFLSLAPNSKLYMNSMLATLNMRHHIRKMAGQWNTVEPGSLRTDTRTGRPRIAPRHVSVSAVEFVRSPSLIDTYDTPSKDAHLGSRETINQ
ncbi:hypothetical protein DFH07DRAFT_954197 [Mycena maculata]|uniref:DUF6534 domain-containing protein n=1 Tax=Mycena maculata TaxID=230809 RepID=A0AAD7JQ49_9AGAR|nr:hypothetical protein DFH07DRAFT_954197 [Mycena maculata]